MNRIPSGLRHLLLAILGAAVLYVVTEEIGDFRNFQLATVGAYVCAVAGLTMLTGGNGQVSLGHAAFLAIGAYTVALLQGHWSDSNTTGIWVLPLSLVVAVLVTGAAGAIIGAAAARLRGPYLAGATLSLGIALPSIASYFSGTFHGQQGLSVPVDPVPDALGSSFPIERWQAWIALSAALLTLLLLANLKTSAIGRHARAVRDDEIAAQLAGISVARTQILSFTISAAAAGLGGGVLGAILQTASPGQFALTLSLALLTAVVIGGLGSLTGAVWGSLVIVFLASGIQDAISGLGLSGSSSHKLHDNLPNLAYGLLLIVVILALPGGIQGVFRRIGGALQSRIPSRGQQSPPHQGVLVTDESTLA